MEKQDEFVLNVCFVLAAFLLSLNGEEWMGIIVGVIAMVYACTVISITAIQHDWMYIGMFSYIELCILECTGISKQFTSLYFLSFVSLFVAFVYSHASRKVTHFGMRCIKWASVVFLLFCFVTPNPIFGFLNSIVIISVIFLPYIIVCVTQMHRNPNVSIVKWMS